MRCLHLKGVAQGVPEGLEQRRCVLDGHSECGATDRPVPEADDDEVFVGVPGNVHPPAVVSRIDEPLAADPVRLP